MTTQQFLDRIDYTDCKTAADVYQTTIDRVWDRYHAFAHSYKEAERIFRYDWEMPGYVYQRDYSRKVSLPTGEVMNVTITDCFVDSGSEDYVRVVSIDRPTRFAVVYTDGNSSEEIASFRNNEVAIDYVRDKAENCFATDRSKSLSVYPVVDGEMLNDSIYSCYYDKEK